jgi:hypothetical protein
VMIGIWWPLGERGLTADGAALPRRALGTYGVYVVCKFTVGWRGGGGRGPASTVLGVLGGELTDKGRLVTEPLGEGALDEIGVSRKPEDVGDIGPGTTSG